jgi:hypothetical protein
MLILDRNNLDLKTFPVGDFSHKIIDETTAINLINTAINTNSLITIYNDENDDYDIGELKSFIKMMKNRFDIDLNIESFFIEDIQKDGEIDHIQNYSFFHTLKEKDNLLVIEYWFVLKDNNVENLDKFETYSDLTFHLFSNKK